MKPWECPRCSKINAPFVTQCTCIGTAKHPLEPVVPRTPKPWRRRTDGITDAQECACGSWVYPWQVHQCPCVPRARWIHVRTVDDPIPMFPYEKDLL